MEERDQARIKKIIEEVMAECRADVVATMRETFTGTPSQGKPRENSQSGNGGDPKKGKDENSILGKGKSSNPEINKYDQKRRSCNDKKDQCNSQIWSKQNVERALKMMGVATMGRRRKKKRRSRFGNGGCKKTRKMKTTNLTVKEESPEGGIRKVVAVDRRTASKRRRRNETLTERIQGVAGRLNKPPPPPEPPDTGDYAKEIGAPAATKRGLSRRLIKSSPLQGPSGVREAMGDVTVMKELKTGEIASPIERVTPPPPLPEQPDSSPRARTDGTQLESRDANANSGTSGVGGDTVHRRSWLSEGEHRWRKWGLPTVAGDDAPGFLHRKEWKGKRRKRSMKWEEGNVGQSGDLMGRAQPKSEKEWASCKREAPHLGQAADSMGQAQYSIVKEGALMESDARDDLVKPSPARSIHRLVIIRITRSHNSCKVTQRSPSLNCVTFTGAKQDLEELRFASCFMLRDPGGNFGGVSGYSESSPYHNQSAQAQDRGNEECAAKQSHAGDSLASAERNSSTPMGPIITLRRINSGNGIVLVNVSPLQMFRLASPLKRDIVLATTALSMVMFLPRTFIFGFIGKALSYGFSLNVSVVIPIQSQYTLASSRKPVERLNQITSTLVFMYTLKEKVNSVLVFLLSGILAGARWTNLHLGKQLHGGIIGVGFDGKEFIASSLEDKYIKSGTIKGVRIAFEGIEKSVKVFVSIKLQIHTMRPFISLHQRRLGDNDQKEMLLQDCERISVLMHVISSCVIVFNFSS